MSFVSSVASYNILHPKHLDRFKDASGNLDHARVAKWSDWDKRQRKIYQEVFGQGFDIVCMQDVPSPTTADTLTKLFPRVGLRYYYTEHPGSNDNGMMTVYNNNFFELVGTIQEESFEYLENTVTKRRSFTFCDLRHRATQKVIRVANCHLLADQTVAVQQMEQIIKSVENAAGNVFATIIAGSFSCCLPKDALENFTAMDVSTWDPRFKMLADNRYVHDRNLDTTVYTESQPIQEQRSDFVWTKGFYHTHSLSVDHPTESEASNHYPSASKVWVIDGLAKRIQENYEIEVKQNEELLMYFNLAVLNCLERPQGSFESQIVKEFDAEIKASLSSFTGVKKQLQVLFIQNAKAALDYSIQSALSNAPAQPIPAPSIPPVTAEPAPAIVANNAPPAAPAKKGFFASICARIQMLWNSLISFFRKLLRV